jgi:hypothetical protein
MDQTAAVATAPGCSAESHRPPNGWLQCGAACGVLIAAGALYLPQVGIPYYADDYLFLSENPRAGLYEYFISYHDMGGEFRPLQMAWNALNQILFGEATVVLQGGQVVLHALLAFLVFRFLVTNGFRPLASFLASFLLAIHPVGVLAVLSNDTFSQVGSTLFGFLSFSLAWRYSHSVVAPEASSTGWPAGAATAIGSVLLLWVALLFKETGLSFAPVVCLTVLYGVWRTYRTEPAPPTRKLAILLGAYVFTVALYFVYRLKMAATGVAFGGSDPYAMRIGPNIAANEVLLFGAALLPLSTVDAFVAAAQRSLPILAGMAVLTVAWVGLLARGLLLSRSWSLVLGVLLLALCATMPVALMNHVSELYSYNLAPFLAVIIALSLGALLQRSRKTWRAITSVILVVVATSAVVAVSRKAAQMRHNGAASARLAAQVVERARALPPGGKLLLVERAHAGVPRYSVFLTTDFHCLRVAERWLKHLAGRPDISIQVVDEQHIAPADMVFVREYGAAGATLVPRD